MSRDSAPRRRGGFRAALIAALLVSVSALGLTTAGAGAADGTPDTQLLQTYQPVLVFHPSELFRPTKVQSFVEDSELERFVGTSLAQLPLDAAWTVVDPDPDPGELPPAPDVFYRLDQTGCEADAALAGRDCYAAAWKEGRGGDVVYGRVVRTESRIVLQYWLFYYDNPFFLPPPYSAFWQSHEGDWELVNVVLGPDEAAAEVAYSQHCTGQRLPWDQVTTLPAGSTHPVAYVALGSHANYFRPGIYPLAPSCIPSFVPAQLRPAIADQVVDGSSVGAVVGFPGSGVGAATIHRIEGAVWASFGGRWGESEYFFAPGLTSTPAPFGLAPASPANQASWSASTVLGWPPAS